MKSNFLSLSLAGLFVSSSLVSAQTAAQPGAQPSANVPTVTAATPAPVELAAASEAPAAAPAAASDAPATPAAPVIPPAAVADAVPAASPAATNAVHDPNAIVPIMIIDDMPLTDAIKHLARLAGLNYMLDPHIPYGAPGPDGRPTPQPSVSLRWENLTPDQALTAVLNNYNLTIVEDPKTKTSRISVKDPAAPDPLLSTTIQLKYADPAGIKASIETTLVDKRSKIFPDVRTSQLVVLATEKELAEINKLVAQLDNATKQVLIEAKLVETSKSPNSVKGIDWSGTVGAQNVQFGNNLYHPDASKSLNDLTTLSPTPGLLMDTAKGFNPGTAFLDADGVKAVLSFLNSDSDARILSTPRAVTLDNELATLSVTRAQPIFQTTAGTQGSPGGAQVTYTNVGTILKVTPHISANNTISLKVIPEVSDVAGTATKTVSGQVSQADIFDIRRIETQVLIPSGNTLVMGGLVSDSTTAGNIKVPLLGDIPFLGGLFRQNSKTQNKKNLIIFVTPTIVQNEDYQPTQTDFLKTRPPAETSNDFGAWDSGKPQDWSKLMSRNQSADPATEPKYPEVK